MKSVDQRKERIRILKARIKELADANDNPTIRTCNELRRELAFARLNIHSSKHFRIISPAQHQKEVNEKKVLKP